MEGWRRERHEKNRRKKRKGESAISGVEGGIEMLQMYPFMYKYNGWRIIVEEVVEHLMMKKGCEYWKEKHRSDKREQDEFAKVTGDLLPPTQSPQLQYYMAMEAAWIEDPETDLIRR
ncbi:hypothetical protein QJS10_CPA03g01872 [Acorus calamus]|uniref:Uncharacterized protein n=1 Tax=Acorus calamus TaxID=4465 RepID=A0AAV9F5N6_ACOCL|nr:hypothetical protein QJS10_CPA03g01872 [Acorus calamus]